MAKKNTKNDATIKKDTNTKNKDTKNKDIDAHIKNSAQTEKKHRLVIGKPTHAIISKPKLFFYNILLDIGFLAIFLLINYIIFNIILPTESGFSTIIGQNFLFFILLALGTVLYVLIMILIYSFFNLIVLGNIKSMTCDHTHDFNMLRRMFLLNLLMFAIFFIIAMLLNILMYLIIDKSIWLIAAGTLMILIIAFVTYSFYNFSSASFILGHKFKDNMKKSLKSIFTRSCLEIIVFSIAVISVYIILYFIIGTIFREYILTNYESFINISNIITLIIIYLLLAFNRIYFFFAAEKHMK